MSIIPVAEFLAGETGESYRTRLNAMRSNDAALSGALELEQASRAAADAGVAASIDAAVTAERAARELADLRDVDPLLMMRRPGDAPEYFADAIGAGDGRDRTPLSVAQVIVDDAGSAVRVTGSSLCAPRRPTPLEPGRVYRITAVVQRRVDSPDPDNDAVRLGVAWYAQDKTSILSTPTTVAKDLLGLRSSDGRRVIEAFVSRAAGASVTVVAPALARYMLPFVQRWGAESSDDIEVIDVVDVTDLLIGVSPGLGAIDGRVSMLEGLDIGARLIAVEAATTGPAALRFKTATQAKLATIPANVDFIETYGYSAPGDRGEARYQRVAGVGATGSIRSADGAWFNIISSVIRPKMLNGDANTAVRRAFEDNKSFDLDDAASAKLTINPSAGDNIENATAWLASRCYSRGSNTAFQSRVYGEIAGWHTISGRVFLNGPIFLDLRGPSSYQDIGIVSISYVTLTGGLCRATVALSAPLSTSLPVGGSVGIQAPYGLTLKTINGVGTLAANDAICLAGAQIVETIAGDRMSFTCLFHPGKTVITPSSLDAEADPVTGHLRNRCIVPAGGLIMRASGWEGSSTEGGFSLWMGAKLSLAYLGLAFSPVGGVGTTHDLVFARDAGTHLHFYDQVVAAGCDIGGRVLRFFGPSQAYINRSFIGGAGMAPRTIEATSGGSRNFIRSCIGGASGNTSNGGAIVTSGGDTIFAACIIAGASVGVRALAKARVGVQSTRIGGVNNCAAAEDAQVYYTNAAFDNYVTGFDWSGAGFHNDFGQVSLDGSGGDCKSYALPDELFGGGAWCRRANRTLTQAGPRVSIAHGSYYEAPLRGNGGIIRISCASLPELTAELSVDIGSPVNIAVGLKVGTQMILAAGAVVSPLNTGKATVSVYMRNDGVYCMRLLNEDGAGRVFFLMTEGDLIFDYDPVAPPASSGSALSAVAADDGALGVNVSWMTPTASDFSESRIFMGQSSFETATRVATSSATKNAATTLKVIAPAAGAWSIWVQTASAGGVTCTTQLGPVSVTV